MTKNNYDVYIFDLFDVIISWLESFIKDNYYYKFLLDFDHEELWKWNISYMDFLKTINTIYDFNVEKLILKIFSSSTPNYEFINLLVKLKKEKKRVILVSDTYKEINNYLFNKYEFLKLFDDVYLSYFFWKTKKSWELFDEIIKNWINPRKSIFIDDSNRNILNAKNKGFNTHKYENFILLKNFLYEN